jgi:hypothetical protein
MNSPVKSEDASGAGRRCCPAISAVLAPGQSEVVLRKECIMRVSVAGATEFTGSAIVREPPLLPGEAAGIAGDLA